MVRLSDVAVRKGPNTLLEQISLAVEAGEILTIIGPNGAGKTTLVRVLLGIERPTSGAIQARPGLRIGYVPQAFNRDPELPITVAAFLRLGHSTAPNAVADLLDRCGAGRVADRQLASLSGGELQRVLLTRALMQTPELLVLDEPVRGVDHMGEAELYRLITELRDAQGFAVVLVSHDLHLVMAQSDRVICLNRHICCAGKPTLVAQHPEYLRLFGRDAANALAVYEHDHDHAHELSGEPHPVATASASISTTMRQTTGPTTGSASGDH
ncbi:MAG: metal ABC transporter ATP-binding protein [Pseudomonadota bacterium]